jgi:thiamine-phosphate pyrophosphorylase
MLPLARLVDANANRAREGLRVLEDLARFVLGRADLAAPFKSLRHDLTAALQRLPAPLVPNRDTPGDTGTAPSPRGYARAGLPDVADAAASRVAEALRCLEEAAKTLGPPDLSRALESLRYRAYDAAQQLALALGSRRRRQFRLCVLLTESLCRLPWLDTARLCADAGADCLQLREKTLGDRELLRRARDLVALARPRGVSVIVNDRPDVAALADADGVHLGQSDLSVGDARRLVGATLLIGVSTGRADQARAARDAGADYCGVGPMFPSSTKDKPRLAGPDYLRDYLADPATRDLPHLAIGGITPDNIASLVALGCRGVAVSSAVCAAEQPGEVCRRLLLSLGTPVTA